MPEHTFGILKQIIIISLPRSYKYDVPLRRTGTCLYSPKPQKRDDKHAINKFLPVVLGTCRADKQATCTCVVITGCACKTINF